MDTNWTDILATLDPKAIEDVVSHHFIPDLLNALGFNNSDWFPNFTTGTGKVDYAARKSNNGAIFLHNPVDPYLLIEVKGRATHKGTIINLATGTPAYKTTKQQITRYLLSPNGQTAQWGIITNATHIQLFRKHGKVVFPATKNHLIKLGNIEEIITEIQNLINKPPKALIFSVYNDKGGVGKTTTVANLAATLRIAGKKVLVIDFDPQQADLTESLGLQPTTNTLSNCLINTKSTINEVIQPFQVKGQKIFDFIAADPGLNDLTEQLYSIQKSVTRLSKLIEPLIYHYDYIIFDAPTNWSFFSKSCIYASDVILIPTQHDNFASLKNAKKVIKDYLPEIQQEKNNGKPIALPIFFNNHSETPASLPRAKKEIDKLIEFTKPSDPDLIYYFYPKYTPKIDDKSIFSLPQYAIISSSAFANVPSVLIHKTARSYYQKLAQEYFLQ